MKKLLFYCFFLTFTITLNSQNVYISEIDYFGNTTDCGGEGQPKCRGLEITGPTGTSLTNWEIKIYDCNSVVHKLLFKLVAELDNGTGGMYSSVWYDSPQLNGDNSDSGGRIELLDPNGNIIDNKTYGPCEMPDIDNVGSQVGGDCSIQAINVAGTPFWMPGVYAPSPGVFNGTNPEELGSCQSSVVLAVEFIDFTAIANNSAIVLQWETANEVNNSHFIIERSTDGLYFEAIGEVAGQGKATIYQYQDLKAPKGINYYRLAQIDFSGQQAVSEVLSVKTANTAVSLAVFPNPTKGKLNILLPALYNVATVIEVYDAVGNLLQSQSVAAQTLLTNLNTENLPSGNYILRLVNGNEVSTQRFIKK